ncbi:TetR/AcrR family transcriptional regulator [Phycicoccus sonneratiae]|uniref:TetR family transcriptional regulator n=1 Tax=Phycicoccus sonneratiae TaxID=2807628 RepID=A0ABS2CPV6_9MICO|nr:TetR/AcrR family transcriptional regulator [Phycicoccus sonneraticus]MBM6401911.1 TetR family transcriptional regulator [Phycicoccus sonneraticus]
MTTGPGPGPGLRDRKKEETRLRLHTVALRLAVERGVGAVTVDEIAAAAEVSPRTFFNYFATKEDALVNTDAGRADAVRTAVLARPASETPAEALRAVLTEHVRRLEADRELWRMRSELAARSPELAAKAAGAGERFETALVEAAYARTGTDPAVDLAPGLTARVAMAAVRAAYQQHRLAGQEGALADRLATAFDAAGLR